MSTNIEINKVFRPEICPDEPYGVEVLIGCSPYGDTQGCSEMSWYAAPEEQEEYYQQVFRQVKAATAAYEIMHDRLQPIYAEILQIWGIATGDINPLTAIELEEAEHQLAAVITHWMRSTGETV